MRQEWSPEDLVEQWTLEEGDRELLGNKTGATRLGFALLLKFFQIEGRIPTYPEEIPAAAVDFVASEVDVDPVLFAKYPWGTRSVKYHRKQIRERYGTRPATEDDEENLARWLAEDVCQVEAGRDALAEAVVSRCRTNGIEPPSPGQVERVVASGLRRFEEAFTAAVAARLGPGVCERLESRVLGTEGALAAVKADPGPLGLETLLGEIDKLKTVQALGIPDEPFGAVSEKIVAAWRARAARMYPSDFAECAEPVRYTLLAALCWTRQAELIDSLVELLIGLIHRINARAEKRVEKELVGELTSVPGKKGILRREDRRALNPLFWTHINPYGRFDLDMDKRLDLAGGAR